MRTRLVAAGAALLTLGTTPALARTPGAATAPAGRHPNTCAPSARPLGYSDALDKVVHKGITVGGLSSLAYDRRAHAWAATVDNHGDDPSRIWYFRHLAHPKIAGDPLVLRHPDHTPYTGMTADNEGLVVLPGGHYLVSSETEPSIRIFGRNGVQKGTLPVPDRFRVAPAGEATANATLEALTISPSGHRVVAGMEGALSGDTDATLHRFLVYDVDARGHGLLVKQVAYRTEPGQRVPEVAAVDDDTLLVEEASYDPATGNAIDLYSVSGLGDAPDVSGVADLATAPELVLPKTHLADLVTCPTLGAPAKEAQTNPLLDNYEAMAITAQPRPGTLRVSLLSDDNFGDGQTTRLLNLVVHLPAAR